MEEIWKDIPGYEGYYQISNLGRVKTLERILPNNRFKNVLCVHKEKIMKQNNDTKGYPAVTLRVNNVIKTLRVHRLVAQAFIPNPENKPQINHVNGVKTDYSIENLEWCNQSENNYHAYRVKLKTSESVRGIKSHHAKLTEEIVLEIRKRYLTENISQKDLSEFYNVGKRNIGHIVNLEIWKHI